MLTSEKLSAAVGAPTARIAPFLAPINNVIAAQSLNTPQRLAAFLAQIAHESNGFAALVESLNYTPQGLADTWPTRFAVASSTTPRTPNPQALQIGRTAAHAADQKAIAEQVYGGRMGNGPAGSGDGWAFRGRGLIQITGRDNYTACGKALGLDLVNAPDQLAQPTGAVQSAGWFWQNINGNKFADAGDFDGLSRRINGGTAGLLDRRARYSAALAVLNAA